MDKQQLLVEYLQGLVDIAISINDPKIFIFKLHAYAIEIFSNPILKTPNKIICDAAAEMDAHLAISKREAFDELIATEIKIREYVTCNNVTNQGVIKAIDTFQARLKKNEQFCRALFFTPLEFAFSHLLNDDVVDHSVFMQEFGKIHRINDYKRINPKDAFPKFCAWENECYYVFQNKEVNGFHALRQLWVFLERYDGKLNDKITDKLIKSGQSTLELRTQSSALMSYVLTGNSKECEGFFSIEEYKHYMVTALNCIRKNLLLGESHEAQEIKSQKTLGLRFNAISGELSKNDKKTFFRKNTNKRVFVRQFFRNDKPKQKKIHMDILLKKIKKINVETHIASKSDKDVIHALKREVNLDVYDKMGIKDLFIVVESEFMIDSAYL